MENLDRIINEYKDINREPISNCGGITVGVSDESNYRKWRISVIGPKDSPYKGGLFCLGCEFPEKYPLEPPEVYFLTPIYHLNINPKAPKSPNDEPLGHISLSTLSFWKPEYTMREVLMNIFYLFYIPNPESPYGIDRAEEFINNKAKYEEKVKYFTKNYANPIKQSKSYNRKEDWDFNFP